MSYSGKKPHFLQTRINELVLPKGTDKSLNATTDYALSIGSDTFIRFITTAGDTSIGGILAPTGAALDGKVIVFTNTSATDTITFLNEDATATAANRIVTGIDNDLALAPGASFFVIYDTSSSRSRIVGGSGGTGSGSGTFKNYLSDWFSAEKGLGTVSDGTVGNVSSRTAPDKSWATSSSASITVTRSATSPIRGKYSYLFGGSGTAANGSVFIETPIFSFENADLSIIANALSKGMYVYFEHTGLLAADTGDFDVSLIQYDGTGAIQNHYGLTSVFGQSGASVPSALVQPNSSQYFAYVPASAIVVALSTNKFALRFRRLANTLGALKIDSIYIGPNSDIGTAAQIFIGDKSYADELEAREGLTVPTTLDFTGTTTVGASETRMAGKLDVASGTTINLSASTSYLVTVGSITGSGTISGTGVITSI